MLLLEIITIERVRVKYYNNNPYVYVIYYAKSVSLEYNVSFYLIYF